MKGKTQGLPEAGPPLVVQVEELGLVEVEVQESPEVTQSPHLHVQIRRSFNQNKPTAQAAGADSARCNSIPRQNKPV